MQHLAKEAGKSVRYEKGQPTERKKQRNAKEGTWLDQTSLMEQTFLF